MNFTVEETCFTGTKSLIVCQLQNFKYYNLCLRLCWFALLESLSSRRSSGHGRQEGCARSGSSTAFVARKAKIKRWMVFGITQVTDVLTVFTFSYLKCLHSWPSISNFRKIFVAERNSYIFFVLFSYQHFTFHVNSLSLKCRLVLFDCVDTNRANQHYHTRQRSLAVHFICSFINHKWDLVCYLFSKSIAPNITGV